MSATDQARIAAIQRALLLTSKRFARSPQAEDFIRELNKLGWGVFAFSEVAIFEASIPRREDMGQ